MGWIDTWPAPGQAEKRKPEYYEPSGLCCFLVSEDAYRSLDGKADWEVSDWLRDHLSESSFRGYGYYSFSHMVEEDGKFKLYYWGGSTCD